jgi:hypothetical protein
MSILEHSRYNMVSGDHASGGGHAAYRTLVEMAGLMGIHRTNARKWLLAAGAEMGIEPKLVRTVESNWQATLAWSEAEADRLLRHREALGFPVDRDVSDGAWRGAVQAD